MLLSRFGGDLLSHVLGRSTIGATALNGRVRDGTGCFARAMTTKPRKEHGAIAVHLPLTSVFIVPRFAFDVQTALLFLDQIKPIGQLVPVS